MHYRDKDGEHWCTDIFLFTVSTQRLVAEVWEAFKNENFAAFQALTDAEVEDIEGEIMRLKRKDQKTLWMSPQKLWITLGTMDPGIV